MQAVIFDIAAFSKLFLFASFAFVVSILLTPAWTNILYKYRLGKRVRRTDYAGKAAPIFARLHQNKEHTPTMGGLLIWLTVALITIFFNLDRAGTWLPLFALVATGFIGAIDDLYNIRGVGPNRGGLRFRTKFLIYLSIALIGAWWFYVKLGWNVIHIPWVGNIEIGWWYVPLFVAILTFVSSAVNVTDGLDGLAGGLLAASFAAFTLIALAQGKVALAVFCGTIVGALLSFLWFNIYPARFFMGDTGSMALGMTLGVVAFLTNSVVLLPLLGFVFFAEGFSVIAQIASRKLFSRKIFLSAPLHHHFQALGWPETKVTMRFWLIGMVAIAVGLGIGLISRI